MSFSCNLCGCIYDWEMFYNNHMRAVHHVTVKRKSSSRLSKRHVNFLVDYYECICDKPSLHEVEELSKFIDVNKESVYWWFHNKRKLLGKTCKIFKFNRKTNCHAAGYKEVKQEPEVSLIQDAVDEGSHDRIPDGTPKRNKTNKETTGRKSIRTRRQVSNSGTDHKTSSGTAHKQ